MKESTVHGDNGDYVIQKLTTRSWVYTFAFEVFTFLVFIIILLLITEKVVNDVRRSNDVVLRETKDEHQAISDEVSKNVRAINDAIKLCVSAKTP